MASSSPESGSGSSSGRGNNIMEVQHERLMWALAKGDAEIIKKMWWSNEGVDMWDVLKSTRDEEGMTALHRAVIAEHKEFVDALIWTRGHSDPDGRSPPMDFDFLHARTHEGWTAIHLAVFCENEAILESLMKTYDYCRKPHATAWDFADRYWMTPLHYAVLGNKVVQMNRLLKWRYYNPHVNARDYFHRTPLHLASCHRSVSVDDLLRHAMVNINAKDSFLQTPFHWAVCFGRVDVVRCLVRILLDSSRRTVQVTDRDFEGRSVLEIASQDTLLDPIPAMLDGLPNVPAELDKWALKDTQLMVHREVNAKVEKLLRMCPDVKEEAESLQRNLTINLTVVASYLLVAGWIASATFSKTIPLPEDVGLLKFDFFTFCNFMVFCISVATLLSCATTLRHLGTIDNIVQRALLVRRATGKISDMLLISGVGYFSVFAAETGSVIARDREAGSRYPFYVILGGGLLLCGAAIFANEENWQIQGRWWDTFMELLSHVLPFAGNIIIVPKSTFPYFHGSSEATKRKFWDKLEKAFFVSRGPEIWSTDEERAELFQEISSEIEGRYFQSSCKLVLYKWCWFVLVLVVIALPFMKYANWTYPYSAAILTILFVGTRDSASVLGNLSRASIFTESELVFLQPRDGLANSPFGDFAHDYWRQRNVSPRALKRFEYLAQVLSSLEEVYKTLGKGLCHHDMKEVQRARHCMFFLDRLPQGLLFWTRDLRWSSNFMSVFFKGYVFGRDFDILESFLRKMSDKKTKLRTQFSTH